jgi:hypothetical protein
MIGARYGHKKMFKDYIHRGTDLNAEVHGKVARECITGYLKMSPAMTRAIQWQQTRNPNQVALVTNPYLKPKNASKSRLY